ncbi:hypothetical protein HDV06_002805 [Boothiomyces sp. JEL0866]|nr:hypothetical protein HDV06_002805 [Boothiomyces sp. JEL0866]
MLFSNLLVVNTLALSTVPFKSVPVGNTNFGNNPHQEDINYIPGGHSMLNPITVHIVWYGKNWKQYQKDIITDFLKGLDKSGVWKVASSYYNIVNNKLVNVSSTVTLGNQVNDYGSFGSYLNNPYTLVTNYLSENVNDVPVIINRYIQRGDLPFDANAIYLLMTDDQTLEGESCTNACGYHYSVLSNQFDVQNGFAPGVIDPAIPDFKYAWLGNPLACGESSMRYGCQVRNSLKSPNGDIGVDSMLSAIFHEIAEASSNPDPEFSAWLANDGNENGDNCAYIYGANVQEKNGVYSNEHWNGRDYYIQRLWDPNTQFCGPVDIGKVPSECKAIQTLFPNAVLGTDCCSSGFAGCSNGHVDAIFGRGNNLVGTVSDMLKYIKNNFPKITQIDLSHNNLTGTIPDDLCSMSQLQKFKLNSNGGVTGNIPNCIGNLKKLEYLTLGGTALNGPIPKSLSDLSALRILTLDSTNISGNLPPSFGSLNNLLELNLAASKLAGPFPSGLAGFQGVSVHPPGLVVCDASSTGLCLPKYYNGPICGLLPCPSP